MVQRPLSNRIWYRGLYWICRVLAVVVFRVRTWGRDNEPQSGGVLVVSNHQSNLDPVIVGLAVHRRLNYLARSTLFGFGPFRWLINSLDAIPIDREKSGVAGLKEVLRRLKRGEMVLIYPEGSRTWDGSVGSFMAGFCPVARRSKVPILPVGFDGAFDAWPRTRLLPTRAAIHIRVGQPFLPEQFAEWSDEELVRRVRARVCECFDAARASRRPL